MVFLNVYEIECIVIWYMCFMWSNDILFDYKFLVRFYMNEIVLIFLMLKGFVWIV